MQMFQRHGPLRFYLLQLGPHLLVFGLERGEGGGGFKCVISKSAIMTVVLYIVVA